MTAAPTKLEDSALSLESADLRELLDSSSPSRLWPRPATILHRIALVVRRVSLKHAVADAAMLSLIAGLVWFIHSPAKLPSAASALIGTLGLFIILLKYLHTSHQQRQREAARRAFIHSLLGKIAETSFRAPLGSRFTWFEIDTVHPTVLVPIVRYSQDLDEIPLNGAPTFEPISRAFYARGVSFTGLAWKLPGVPLVHEFPIFTDRAAFDNYYTTQLHVPSEIVQLISNSMLRARTIFCLGLPDPFDATRVLGVLSADFPTTISESQWPRVLDSTLFRVLIETMADVVLTFSRAPR
ncbi:hypothetical protein PHYC_02029 [Phycisphaerales bacterium]|nr:hypothetical protein PHYC_02029 [Phycisphaerales bacterium]